MTTVTDIGEPNLTQVLEEVISVASEEVRVCVPGVVTSADMENARVDVQPAIKRSGSIFHEPIVQDVPLWFPRSTKASFTFPVETGDDVLLVFSDRSLEDWLAVGGGRAVNAQDSRIHDITDAIAIPGKLTGVSSNRVNDINLEIGGAELLLTGSGKIALGNSSAEVLEVISDFMNVLLTFIGGLTPMYFDSFSGPCTLNVTLPTPPTSAGALIQNLQTKIDALKATL